MTAITYYLAKQNTAITPAVLSPAQAKLISIGDRCLDFGERAVANDIPIIEFQQLQREAKRSDVIQRCMTDNGYVQNPKWASYAQPIAIKDAQIAKISIDEATINLGRKHMRIFENVTAQPVYWVKK